MASLKEVKGRIASVNSTKKITSAMKMVASAKLHKAQNAIENMLPYERKLNHILNSFLGTEQTFDSSYVARREVKRAAIVVFSSNTSLCGGFNANIIKHVLSAIGEYKPLGWENLLLYPVGKKVADALKNAGFKIQGNFQDMADKPSYGEAASLARTIGGLYAAKELDKVELIYNHFRSTALQILMRETYLPIQLKPEETEGNKGYAADYIVEPSVKEVMEELIPMLLNMKIYTALLDSVASEHAARTMAMQTATDNANELLQDLTVLYNKSRQQAITNELLDIVGGSMQ